MHPLGRTFPRWGKAQYVEELRTKEQAETDRKVQESLDNFIRQTMGQEPYASLTKLPGWPLLSPSKVQMQKCDKCTLEFCSPINHRRHIRAHRRSLAAENENYKKERPNVAAFWNKLTPDEASQILSLKNFKLEELSGAASMKALSSLIKQHGLSNLPQLYIKAGATLLDLVQNKVPAHTITADELFSIMDNASEQTFLCGGTSLAVQRFVYHGEIAKLGLENKNVVASVAFLLENKLVKAWMVDKDAEALRFQKELVEEEEASQMRRQKLLERKRQKKLRQKVSKEREKQTIVAGLGAEFEEGDFADMEDHSMKATDDCRSPTGTASSCTSSTSVGKPSGLKSTQAADYSAKWDAIDIGNPSSITGTFQSACSSRYYDGLMEGSSVDMEPPHDADECPPNKNGRHSSTDLHNGDVSMEDDLSKSFMSSDGRFIGEVNNLQERVPQLQLEDGERNTYIQHRQNGGWKGNEHESYSIHFRNHEVEKSALHRKNGRLIWERRPSVPFEKARITNEAMGNEERFRNSFHRQPNRPYRTNSIFANGIKAEHRPSSDFEAASAPRFPHYRPKILRTKHSFSSTANGYAVWTRKIETPAVLLDPADSTENCESINTDSYLKEDEKPLLFSVKSVEVETCEELSEKDAALGTVNVSLTMPNSSNFTSCKQLAPEMPILSNLQCHTGNVLCSSEESSPSIKLVKETQGMGAIKIGANHGAATAGDFLGVVQMAPLTANSYLKDEHVLTNEEKSDALIVGSLSIPLNNIGGNGLFHYIPQIPSEMPASQETPAISKSSENWGSVWKSNEIVFQNVENMEHESSINCDTKSVEANCLSELGRIDDKEFNHSSLETNAAEKLSKQMSGRSVSSKVWRAVGFVGDKQGANAMKSSVDRPITILSESTIGEDAGSCLTGNYKGEDSIHFVERPVDLREMLPQVVASENTRSAVVYGVEIPQNTTTSDRGIEDCGLSKGAASDEIRAKNHWDQSSTFSSAASSSFLSLRWEAAVREVEGSSRS